MLANMAGRIAALFKPNKLTLINLFLDSGASALTKGEAQELYRVASNHKLIDANVLQSYLAYHSKRGNVDETKEGLLKLAPQHNIRTDTAWSTFLIEAHIECGDVVKAQALLRDLTHVDKVHIAEGHKDALIYEGLYLKLIQKLAGMDRLKNALDVFEKLRSRRFKPSRESYTLVINATIEKGAHNAAWELIDEMRLAGLEPQVETLANLIKLKLSRDRYGEAMKLFKQMQSKGPQPNTAVFNAIIVGSNAAGDHIAATSQYQRNQNQHRHMPRETFFAAMDSYARLKNLIEIRRVWTRMEEVFGEQHLGEEDYALYMTALVRAGEMDDAMAVLEKIHAKFKRSFHTAQAMLFLSTQYKELEMAGEQFALMRAKGYLTQSTAPWNDMITLLATSGKKKEAQALFEEMKTTGKPYPDTKIFNAVLTHGCVTAEEVNELLPFMAQHEATPNTTTYAHMIRILGEAKDWIGCGKIIATMKNEGFSLPSGLHYVYKEIPEVVPP